jgi:hypothetical protein
MNLAAETDTFRLDLAGEGSVAVMLFAGGTTGLVLLDSAGEQTAFWTSLGELAETDGLSALAFVEPVPGDPVGAAVQAARLLARLGVQQAVIAAEGADAPAALRAAAHGCFAAVVLFQPAIPDDELESLLEETRMAKLVLVVDNDAVAQAFSRHAIGPTVIRHLPRSDTGRGAHLLTGEVADLVAETILGFAISVCGDGRRG